MEKEIRQISRDWDRAIQENDIEGMAAYMADDWVLIGTEGGITQRETFLNAVRSGSLVHTQMEFENIRAKVYGDTAVITSRGTSSGTWEGNPFNLYEWSSSTFIRKNEKWLCVLTMLTPANSTKND